MTRENRFLEAHKALMAQNERMENKRLAKLLEAQKARESFKDNYYRLIESREIERAEHEKLMEAARDDAFSTALKAIYLTALEAATLTDQGIILAENMVDTWIQENGGATKILGKAQNKSYFLARLTQLVEEAARIAVAEAEDDSEPETDDDAEEKKDGEEKDAEKTNQPKDKSDSDDTEDAGKDEEDEDKEDSDETSKEDSADAEDDSSDDSGEDEESGDSNSETDDDNESSSEDDESDAEDSDDGVEEVEDHSDELDELTDDEVDSEEDAEEDDDVEDVVGEPLDDDGMDSDDTVDGNEDKGQFIKDLEAEPDVQKAVELIRSRVADAEETFIKNNARDKKEIDELVSRLSDSIKTVDAIKDKDSREAKVAQEHVDMIKRDIDKVHEGYLTDVFSNMARALNKGIMKHQAVLENYQTEDGKLDTDLVVETTKVMYGFIETLRTLKLAKIDEAYIADAINQMEK